MRENRQIMKTVAVSLFVGWLLSVQTVQQLLVESFVLIPYQRYCHRTTTVTTRRPLLLAAEQQQLRPTPPPLDGNNNDPAPQQPYPPKGEPPLELLLQQQQQKQQQNGIVKEDRNNAVPALFFASENDTKKGSTVVVNVKEEGVNVEHNGLQWSDFGAESLRHELQSRGLPISGDKATLVARLEQDDLEREQPLFLSKVRAGSRLVDQWFSSEIEKGVSQQAIQGAAITAALLGAVVGKGITTASVAGLGAAYVAITPGKPGDIVRAVGNFCYNTTNTVSGILHKLDPDDTLLKLPVNLAKRVFKPLEERRVALAAYQAALKHQSETAAVATRRAMMEYRFANEARELEERRKIAEEKAARELLEARIELEALEKAKQEAEEQERLATAARLAAEARLAEEARMAEEARLIEQAQLLEKQRQEEEARLEAEKEAARRKKEEAARVAEEMEAVMDLPVDEISDEDWEASVQAAQGSIDESIAGMDDAFAEDDIAYWEAAEQRASEIGSSPVNDLKEDLDMEALGQATREAVEDFEKVQRAEEEEKRAQRGIWSSQMKAQPTAPKDQTAREPVDMFEQNVPGAPPQGWSKLTVVQLKDELRNRGLPTSGKKAKLVALLESDDPKFATAVSGSQEDTWEEKIDVEEVGKAARSAVEAFERGELPTLEGPEVGQGWSKLTVAELRSELKSRGLPTSGKKADLIAALEADSIAMDDLDLGEFKRAALEAVQRFAPDEEPSDEALWEIDLSGDEDDSKNGGLLWERDEAEDRSDVSFWEIEEKSAPQPDYSSMTVVELKEELRRRGLSLSGRKADLIKRLQQ